MKEMSRGEKKESGVILGEILNLKIVVREALLDPKKIVRRLLRKSETGSGSIKVSVKV